MLIHTSVRSLNYYLASHVNKLIERLIPFDISYYLAFHSHLSQFICRLKYKVGLRFSMEGISVECCLVMLCCSGLIDIQLSVDEKTNEDLTQSFTDKSRGLSQTSHSTEQSVFSSEYVRVDTSCQLDTALLRIVNSLIHFVILRCTLKVTNTGVNCVTRSLHTHVT